jgi:aspartyl-tRNA(Asn)/glutamyl-tRNA(Gln) amidotransferase subunit A
MEFVKHSIPEISKLLKNKKISCSDLVDYYAQRSKKYNSDLNVFITSEFDSASLKAKQIDANGGILPSDSMLKGIPVSLKDNMITSGVKTTCGSKILSNFVPAFDSTVWNRLNNSGSLLVGKCNMDEFAMGSSNESSFFGSAKNPWNTALVPGGSSGGSGVAVSAGLSHISYGSDTGGSVRLPACFNGVYALKPTYGRVSRYGIVAYASSLDQVGPFARNIDDLAIAFDAVSGVDEKDGTTSSHSVTQIYEELLNKYSKDELKNMKIGIPSKILKEGVSDDVMSALEKVKSILSSAGVKIVDVDLPHSKYALDVYYIIATAEASSNLARFDGVRYGHRAVKYKNLDDLYCSSRGEGFGEEVKRRMEHLF